MRLIFLIMLCIVFLNGCQSYIAYQITKSPKKFATPEYEHSIALSGTKKQYCNSDGDCLNFRFISPKDIDNHLLAGNTVSLRLVLKGTTEEDMFEYKLSANNLPNDADDGLLIIFPGYGVDSLVYTMQARWLSHITGKNVIVMPASNQYDQFKFGLNSLDLLNQYIHAQHYRDISLLSYSMGAVAAIDLSTKLDINQHILFAPMINFQEALNTIAKLSHPIYSKLLGDNYLNGVADKIIQQSAVPINKLNLLSLLNTAPHAEKTYVFASNADKVSPYKSLRTLSNRKINVYEVTGLNHIEMVSLISKQQRQSLIYLLNE